MKRRVLKDKRPNALEEAKKNWAVIKKLDAHLEKLRNKKTVYRKPLRGMRAKEMERMKTKGFQSDVDMLRRMWRENDIPHAEAVKKIRSMRPGISDAYLVKIIEETERISKIENDAVWESILENLDKDKPVMDKYKKKIEEYKKGKITKKQLDAAYEQMRKELEKRDYDNWRNVNR